jgi:hypothetical protein
MYMLGVGAYAVAVFQRASLGVTGVDAQQRFGTTAAVLALFGVLQLSVYAGLQIPVGVLLDRVGSRRLIARRRGKRPARHPARTQHRHGARLGRSGALAAAPGVG